MWSALGDTLPLAVGLTLSPIALITGLILLLGDRGAPKAALFGAGWFTAIVILATIAMVLVDRAEEDDPVQASKGVDIVSLFFGLLFFVLAYLTWHKRGQDGEKGPEHKLLDRLNTIGVGGAYAMGVTQGFVVIKNWPLALGSGALLGAAGLDRAQSVLAVILFGVMATGGVIALLVVTMIGGNRLNGPLAEFREWLEANILPITLTTLLFFGSFFLGKGLGILG